MKILLDTTYFLPVIGISIKGIPQRSIIDFIEKGFLISMSEITLFEISAKGAKYVASGILTPVKVSMGIRALIYDDRIIKFPIYDTSIMLTAFKLRKFLNDFIDCIILSTAINETDVLVTEDVSIHRLFDEESFLKIVNKINPEFIVKSYKQIL